MLYIVGTAFIVLVLSKERTVRIHKTAATTDELTGLLNRRGFYTAARALCQRQSQRGEQVSVLLFDLDHFKKINDRFGHAVGDEALRLFAATVGDNLRASDIVGRFGGEEFVVMLPGSIADAAAAAERVRVAFEAAGVTVANQPLCATVSIGAASGMPGADLPAMLAAADAALYRAKDYGRNRVELAGETLGPSVPPVGAAAKEAGIPATQPVLAS
jgi:diguanylate cyclase (GGDEF)-like protein